MTTTEASSISNELDEAISNELDEAITNRDDERVHKIILSDPLVAREALIKMKDDAQSKLDSSKAQLQQMFAASMAYEIDRVVYERAAADHRSWEWKHKAYMKALGRFISAAQNAQGAIKREKSVTFQEERDRAHRMWLAIAAHRQACLSEDIEPEAHDLALWAILDQERT